MHIIEKENYTINSTENIHTENNPVKDEDDSQTVRENENSMRDLMDFGRLSINELKPKEKNYQILIVDD